MAILIRHNFPSFFSDSQTGNQKSVVAVRNNIRNGSWHNTKWKSEMQSEIIIRSELWQSEIISRQKANQN